ncbi:hypothetical protein D3C78_1858190 [compost metagenome]
MGPHHGHVAGMIGNAIALLIGAIMLLIEHQHAQLAKRQEQGRTCTDHSAHRAVQHAAPHLAALHRGHV